MVETVRCIILDREGRILLLQKTPDSKAAGLYEFPGGKIEGAQGESSTLDEQIQTVIAEVLQETNISLDSRIITFIEQFTYSFEHNGKNIDRIVYVFKALVHSFDAVLINKTMNGDGLPEDNHARSVTVDFKSLEDLNNQGILSGNSTHYHKAFD